MSFLSGAFGETDNLPRALELVADVLPLKYLIELVLASYVDGEPLSEHVGAIGVLTVWGAAGYLIARARFGWEPRER
jgi:ABC-type multidrug transport system permease subunit